MVEHAIDRVAQLVTGMGMSPSHAVTFVARRLALRPGAIWSRIPPMQRLRAWVLSPERPTCRPPSRFPDPETAPEKQETEAE
jgi:hypothetical protein